MATRKKKDFMKAFVPTLTENAVRGAGASASAWLSNQIMPDLLKKATEKNPNILKVRGPITFIAGSALQAFVDNEYLKNAAQGMSSMGFVQSAHDFMPQDQANPEKKMINLGLQGALPVAGNLGNAGQKALPPGTDFDWDSLANEAVEIPEFTETGEETLNEVAEEVSIVDKY